jgi:pSer/pThr/pTyr-binding forkhead associated (FHA) protein
VSDKTKIESEFFGLASQSDADKQCDEGPEDAKQPAALGSHNGSPFRPVHRSRVPVLIVLDDGCSDRGEKVRLREKRITIGRSESHVCIPHDSQISKQHAEIVRVGDGIDAFWQLRDLGSANKTFVRCREIVLQPTSRFLLGSYFFHFRPAERIGADPPEGDKTTTAVRLPSPSLITPALVCESQAANIDDQLLARKTMSIGRPGYGNDLEIDDALLAEKHAEVKRLRDGSWRLLSLSSQNGIWAEIDGLRLSQKCRFRCGEQEFLFVLP